MIFSCSVRVRNYVHHSIICTEEHQVVGGNNQLTKRNVVSAPFGKKSSKSPKKIMNMKRNMERVIRYMHEHQPKLRDVDVTKLL